VCPRCVRVATGATAGGAGREAGAAVGVGAAAAAGDGEAAGAVTVTLSAGGSTAHPRVAVAMSVTVTAAVVVTHRAAAAVPPGVALTRVRAHDDRDLKHFLGLGGLGRVVQDETLKPGLTLVHFPWYAELY